MVFYACPTYVQKCFATLVVKERSASGLEVNESEIRSPTVTK